MIFRLDILAKVPAVRGPGLVAQDADYGEDDDDDRSECG